jgi:hypothetical protein
MHGVSDCVHQCRVDRLCLRPLRLLRLLAVHARVCGDVTVASIAHVHILSHSLCSLDTVRRTVTMCIACCCADNRMGPASGEALAAALRENSTLVSLNIASRCSHRVMPCRVALDATSVLFWSVLFCSVLFCSVLVSALRCPSLLCAARLVLSHLCAHCHLFVPLLSSSAHVCGV